MTIEYAVTVNIGKKETNDDRVLVNGQIHDECSQSGAIDLPAIVAVCDGCGGYQGGYIAAETVLEFLSFEDPKALNDAHYLAEVLEHCQQMVMEKKQLLPAFSEMCTTIAGCVFGESSIIVFHAGDSRVYRHDRWGIARMTRDHSVVQEMIDMGEITPEEALVHPKRNVISRCIGVNGRAPEIYFSYTSINPGEKYLFCSDGLWETVTDREIEELLGSDLSLQEMADVLVEKAISQGADDNISVCICSRPGQVIAPQNKPFILD